MDEHVRERERRFRQTGTVDDEAAWLAARRAAGHITTAGLELLAHAGSEAASRIAGIAVGGSDPGNLVSVRAWLHGFETRGRDVVRRVAISIASTTVERWRALVPDGDQPVQAVELGRSVLEGTTAANRRELTSVKKRLARALWRVQATRDLDDEAGSDWYWEVGERLLDACLASTPEQVHVHLLGILRATPGNAYPELLAAIPVAVRRDLEAWLTTAPGPPDS